MTLPTEDADLPTQPQAEEDWEGEPPQPQERRNNMCPEWNAKMQQTRDPLICRGCRCVYHVNCALTTQDALMEQRRGGTWECSVCRVAGQLRPARPTSEATSVKRIERRKGLRIVQWKCDGLDTKREMLEELLRNEKIHMAVIQETKLGNKDATPNIRGYTAFRKDRYGSGVTKARGGGLCTYVMGDLPHREKNTQTTGILEAQTLVIPREGGENLEVTNFYIPTARGEGAADS